MAEDKYNANYNEATEEKEKAINFQDLFYLCINNWYWFLISLTITFGIALLYMLTTIPTYTRSAAMLVEYGDDNRLSEDFGRFSSVGGSGAGSNIYNDMFTIKSPSYMYEVVKNLNLDIEYTYDGPFHKWYLYGNSTPLKLSFPDLEDNESCSLTMVVNDDGTVTFSNFILNGEAKQSKALKAKINTMVQTPVGKVLATPTQSYGDKHGEPIYVSRRNVNAVTNYYAGSLRVDLISDRASVIGLSIDDVSPRRAEDVLNNVYQVYNRRWVDDINQQAINTMNFIDEELGKIESELGNVDADISNYKSKTLVPNVTASADMYVRKADNTSNSLLELNNQLYMAKYIRAQLNGSGTKYSLLPPNSGIDNISLASQINSYNNMVLQRNSLIGNSSTNNPLIADLDQSLNASRQAILSSLDNIITGLNTRINSLKGSESETKSKIATKSLAREIPLER